MSTGASARARSGIVLVALCAFAAVSCSSAPPPRAGSPGDASTPEALALNAQSDEIEREVRKSEITVDDPVLQSYLDSVVRRLLPHLAGPGTQARAAVVRDPFLNAAALSNGFLLIHTGLLTALENEAQLATVVAHELEHFAGRHALRQQLEKEHARSTRNALMGLSIILTPLPGLGLIPLFGASAAGHDAAGFSRELEREADAAAIRAITAAGYDANEAPHVYELLLAEEDEGDAPERHSYGMHPALSERLASSKTQLQKLNAASAAGARRTDRDAYEQAIAGILLPNGELDLALKRYGRARSAAERYMRLRPRSAEGPLALGRILQRQAGHDRDKLEEAAAAYARAVELDPKLAAARRELGLVALDLGKRDDARKHLSAFLAIEPQAVDRAIVESYLR